MTNDLFRDLLDGRIRCPRQARAEHRERILHRTELYVELMTAAIEPIIEAYERFGTAVNDLAAAMQAAGIVPTPPPADPRARALWTKQQQGHGPDDGLLRNRGRVMRYREKG